jgi:hypothetical protein
MVLTDGRGSFWPSSFAGIGGAIGPLKGGGRERWGVAQWVCAQCSELGKFGIAKVEVEYRLGQVVGIKVAGRVSERVSPKDGVLPSWSGMVYDAGPLLLLPQEQP